VASRCPAVAAIVGFAAGPKEGVRDREERRLRDALEWIRGGYDSAKVSNVVFIVIRDLEVEIAWRKHAQQEGGRA
jgi:hypothetical protein